MNYEDATEKDVGANSGGAEKNRSEEIVGTKVRENEKRAPRKDATLLKRLEPAELSSKELVDNHI